MSDWLAHSPHSREVQGFNPGSAWGYHVLPVPWCVFSGSSAFQKHAPLSSLNCPKLWLWVWIIVCLWVPCNMLATSSWCTPSTDRGTVPLSAQYVFLQTVGIVGKDVDMCEPVLHFSTNAYLCSLTSKAVDLLRSSCSMFMAALATSSSASFCSTL